MCDLVLLCPPPESLPSKLFLPLLPNWASSPLKLRDDGVQQVSAPQRRLSSAVQPEIIYRTVYKGRGGESMASECEKESDSFHLTEKELVYFSIVYV